MKTLQEKPNRRMIETLLEDLSGVYGWAYEDEKVVELEQQCNAMEKKLLDVKPFKELSRRLEAAKKEATERCKDHVEKVAALRREYLASGITPQLLKQLAELVKRIAK